MKVLRKNSEIKISLQRRHASERTGITQRLTISLSVRKLLCRTAYNSKSYSQALSVGYFGIPAFRSKREIFLIPLTNVCVTQKKKKIKQKKTQTCLIPPLFITLFISAFYRINARGKISKNTHFLCESFQSIRKKTQTFLSTY